jgi:hypothetical protein
VRALARSDEEIGGSSTDACGESKPTAVLCQVIGIVDDKVNPGHRVTASRRGRRV